MTATAADVTVVLLDCAGHAGGRDAVDEHLLPEERRGPLPVRVARAALRQLLGEAIGVAPMEVEISRRCLRCGHATHGKPHVANGAQCSFSLSHSGDRGLLVYALDGSTVGADIEMVRDRTFLDDLARRVLAPSEHALFEAAAPEERPEFFARCWVAKEAYLKAIGQGVITNLRDVRVDDPWSVTMIDAGRGACAALAVDRERVNLTTKRWSWGPTNGGIAR